YLESVEYLGRGQNQSIVYVFGEEAGGVPDTEAVELLMAEGLSFTSAYSLARRYPLERIRDRLERFRAILASGYRPKNRLGFLVDVIRDEGGKYARALPAGRTAKHQALAEKEARRPEGEAEREWQSFPREAQIRRALQVVHLILRSRVSIGEVEELARRMEQGSLNPKALLDELKTAAAEGRLED
ncbi:MAG: plasmid replication initiator protein, partial [Thermus sp.]